MNQTLVEERKVTLAAMKEQKLLAMKTLLADVKLIDGAIADCDYWIMIIDKEDMNSRIERLKNAK